MCAILPQAPWENTPRLAAVPTCIAVPWPRPPVRRLENLASTPIVAIFRCLQDSGLVQQVREVVEGHQCLPAGRSSCPR